MSSFRVAFTLYMTLLVSATSASAGERGTTTRVDLPPPVATAVARYSTVLAQITGGKGGRDLESLFSAARKLKEVLLRNVGEENVIEQLTAKQFDEVVRRARGVVVNREEVLLVEPDASFFLSLARTYGTKVDIAFAEAFAATYPDGVWPSYVWQETDVTGCTAFGSGELVARYGEWLSFRSRHPNAYRTEVLERLQDIESEVGSGCACGSRADVLTELDEFAREFPATALRIGLAERVASIRAGRAEMRFNCTPN